MYCVCMYVCVAQSYLTLCNPMDYWPPSISVHGILQARILEWVAMPFSRGSFQPRDQTQVSCVFCITGRFFTTEPLGKPQLNTTHPYKACSSLTYPPHFLGSSPILIYPCPPQNPHNPCFTFWHLFMLN